MEKKTCSACGCILIWGTGDNWTEGENGELYCDQCSSASSSVKREADNQRKINQERYDRKNQ